MPISERCKKILSEMTLEEKLAQLGAYMFFDTFWHKHDTYDEQSRIEFIRSITPGQMIPEEGLGFINTQLRDLPPALAAEFVNQDEEYIRYNTRLKIPAIIHDEGVHGLIGNGSTIFPSALGLAATFDIELMERVADAIGREARTKGVRHLLSPTLNLARDPRCGRVEETYGESPVLASEMGVAYIQNVQKHGVICTAKHFVDNFESDGGRDSVASFHSERFLREVLFPPFKAAVKKAKVHSVMCSYNSYDGVPCAGNEWLLTKVLRKEWGFEGFVVADYHAVVHQWALHGTAKDKSEAAAMAIKAGLDVELPRFDCFAEPLQEALKKEMITQSDIDQAVLRVLSIKEKIGLFEGSGADGEAARQTHRCKEHLSLAMESSISSHVLLKNENNILPFKNDVQKIAVIGPNADSIEMGDYSWDLLTKEQVVTPLEGLKKRFDDKISYTPGCSINDQDESQFQVAVELAKSSDVVLFIGGSSLSEAGEARDRQELELPEGQEKLIQQLASLNVPVVVVLYSGGIHVMENWIDKVDTVIHGWYGGEQVGHALASIVSGDGEPGGRLPLTIPSRTGQCPVTHDMRPSGRGHTYQNLGVGGSIRFPFGFGLTYSEFEYSDLRLPEQSLWEDDSIRVKFQLKNTGQRSGTEVAQVYVRDTLASVVRPLMEFKAWKKVSLQKGAEKEVCIDLPVNELRFPGRDLQPTLEEGEIEIMVGPNSLDHRLKGKIQLAKSWL